MRTPRSTKSRSYPAFIRSHSIVQSFEKQDKIFPKIGLKNSSAALDLDKGNLFEKGLLGLLAHLKDVLVDDKERCIHQYYDLPHTSRIKRQHIIVFNRFIDALNAEPKSFIAKRDGHYDFVLPFHIVHENIEYTVGSNLIRCIISIRNDPYLPPIGHYSDWLNDCNSLRGDKKIVFSGSGNKCLWDLATMSMRGINSCQRWQHHLAKALAGSMIDPYAGIIYITDGNNSNLGVKMMRRAVVRFVLNKKTKKPAIMIERIYPFNAMGDPLTLAVFTRFIKAKTKNKFDVFYGEGNSRVKNYFIPQSTAVTTMLAAKKKSELSYRDSKIMYRPFDKDVSNII